MVVVVVVVVSETTIPLKKKSGRGKERQTSKSPSVKHVLGIIELPHLLSDPVG